MTNATGNNLDTTATKSKFTAANIKRDCPARLREIGRETAERVKDLRQLEKIAKQLEKLSKQVDQAYDDFIVTAKLIAEAKELCEEGGFDAFRKSSLSR